MAHRLSIESITKHTNRLSRARLDVDPMGRAYLGAFRRRRSPCVHKVHGGERRL